MDAYVKLISKKSVVLAILSAAVFAFWIVSADAEQLSNPPAEKSGLIDSIGFVSVLLSTANLPVQEETQHRVVYTLRDGTRIGGSVRLEFRSEYLVG